MSNKNIPSSSEDIALFIQQKAISHTNRKSNVDKLVKAIFFGLAFLSVLIVLATLVYLLYSGLLPFFKSFPLRETGEQAKLHFWKFISGTSFASPYFGIGWLIVNTIYMTLLSLVITIPTGILTALFITRVASKFLGSIINTIITVLSGIPSVIIGVFAMGVLKPLVRDFASSIGYQTAGGKATLTAVLVLAIMSLPTIISMTVTAIKAVDNKLIMASLALGASKTQTNFKIVLTAAQSGIFASIILGMGRAIGEATAVQMVIGASSGPSFSLFRDTASLTTKMLEGINELSRTSLDYNARFTVGLILMVVILFSNLCLNACRNYIYRKNNGIVKKKVNYIQNIKDFTLKIKSKFKKEDNNG